MSESCPKCGPVDPYLRWKTLVDGRLAIEASCPSCKRWLKWAAQTLDNVEQANHAITETPQQTELFGGQP
jgi:hypothetical protein